MTYKEWTKKKWRVTGCVGSLDVQVSDLLKFAGDGKGGPGSKLCRNINGRMAEWGSRCVYVNGTSETVTGTHKVSGQTFTISRTTVVRSEVLKCFLKPDGTKRSEKGTRKREPGASGSGSGAGGGSWTAEEGG